MAGFEPATSRSQTRRATKLRYVPSGRMLRCRIGLDAAPVFPYLGLVNKNDIFYRDYPDRCDIWSETYRFRNESVREDQVAVDHDLYFDYLRSDDFRSIVATFERVMNPVVERDLRFGRPRAHAPASMAVMHEMVQIGMSDRLAEAFLAKKRFWAATLATLIECFPEQYSDGLFDPPNRSAYKRMKGRIGREARIVGVLPEFGEESQLVFDVRRGSQAELFVNLSRDPESSESIVLTVTRTGIRTEFYGEDGQKFAETFKSYEELTLDALRA